jgi:hypothetical protein
MEGYPQHNTFVKVLSAHPDWWQYAACRGMSKDNYDIFFHQSETWQIRNHPRIITRIEDARAVTACAHCTVYKACLEDALSDPSGQDYGYRARMTADQRHTLRIKRMYARDREIGAHSFRPDLC